MGKKVLRIGFVVVAVGIVIAAAINVALLTNEEWEKATKAEPKGLALEVRDKFAESVDDTLGGREAKLGLAYLAGMKTGLDKETLEMLRAVGLAHIVVASGTHLGIIVGFSRKWFGKVSRFAGALFSLVFIFVFGQIIGWTASITRAAIVAALSIVGWYFGRRLEAWRVILFAMATTLFINPLYIIDLGWLLSFASFIGILIIAPILTEFFYGRKPEKKPNEVAKIIIASVAALLMCVPISIYYFGSFSAIAVVANLLILPTIPLAMGLTFLTGLVGFLPSFFLFDWLRFLLTKITTILLDYHLAVVEFFSKQTSFILTLPKENPWVFLLYLPIIVLVVVYYARRAKRRQRAKLRVWSNSEKYLPLTR